MRIILGITGSVAATLTNKLVDMLPGKIDIILTERSKYFLPDLVDIAAFEDVNIYDDTSEWGEFYTKGDEVFHVKLATEADMMLICPITANSLAKIACGICDSLLTCTVKTWGKTKPLIIAPAMHTNMWYDDKTQEDLETLSKRYNLTIIPPISKVLACGFEGMGALANLSDIVNEVKKYNKGEN